MKIPRWALVAVVLVVGVWVGKDLLAKLAVRGGVRLVTGLDASIGSLQVGVLDTSIGVRSLQVRNPAGFQDQVMVDLPELYVDYDLGAALKGDVHLELVRLYLKELRVIKNADGRLNLHAIKGLESDGPAPPPSAKAGAFAIDALDLKIGTVTYTDYTVSPPSVKTFAVNLDEHFERITNPTVFAGLVVSRALMKTTIAQLANFDVTGLQSMVTQGLRDSAGLVTGTATHVATEAASQLQGGATDAAKGAADVATKAVGGVGGSLKKLFGN